MKLSTRCIARLSGLHPDLERVIYRAAEISDIDFIITEGLRTKQRQAELMKAGASKTMNSRHLDGHAADLAVKVGDEVRWDWPLYSKLALIMKEAARIEGVAIEWGGDWRTLKDGPHYQLPWAKYPGVAK